MEPDPTVLQLWRACYTGDAERVQQLIEDSVDFCQRDRNGETVLHMAARSDNPHILNILLDHLSPDVHNQNQQTPLHLAAIQGHLSIVDVLLQADCKLDQRTKVFLLCCVHEQYSQMTPLHLACQHGRTQVAAALLQGGAVCNSADTIGKPPQFYTDDPNIRRLFKDHATRCTHIDNAHPHPFPSPDETSDTNDDTEDNDDDNEKPEKPTSDDDEKPKKMTRKKSQTTRKTTVQRRRKKTVAKAPKKIKVNHGLGFSEQHQRRMEMNVFDRLMGNKNK